MKQSTETTQEAGEAVKHTGTPTVTPRGQKNTSARTHQRQLRKRKKSHLRSRYMTQNSSITSSASSSSLYSPTSAPHSCLCRPPSLRPSPFSSTTSPLVSMTCSRIPSDLLTPHALH